MDETTEWLRVPAAQPRGTTTDRASLYGTDPAKPLDSPAPPEEAANRLAILQGDGGPYADVVDVVLFVDQTCTKADVPGDRPVGEGFRNRVRSRAAIRRCARDIDANLVEIDFGGMDGHLSRRGVINIPLGPNLADFRQESQLTRHQLACAMHAGRHAAERSKLRGTQLFIGEVMGTGVLSRAAALACSLLTVPPEHLLASDDAILAHGSEEIRCGPPPQSEQQESPIEALRRLGGFSIAALTGSYMACAHMGLPILVDGLVSSVAALTAARLTQGAENWLLFSQHRREHRHQVLFAALGTRPFTYIAKDSHDGAGAAAAVPSLRHACSLYGDSDTVRSRSGLVCSAPSAFR